MLLNFAIAVVVEQAQSLHEVLGVHGNLVSQLSFDDVDAHVLGGFGVAVPVKTEMKVKVNSWCRHVYQGRILDFILGGGGRDRGRATF